MSWAKGETDSARVLTEKAKPKHCAKNQCDRESHECNYGRRHACTLVTSFEAHKVEFHALHDLAEQNSWKKEAHLCAAEEHMKVESTTSRC